jgi:hypothetical protein
VGGAQAAHVAGVGQFADHAALRRAVRSGSVNGGRGRWLQLRSVGASENRLLGAGAASLVHFVGQAEAVDGLALRAASQLHLPAGTAPFSGLRSRIGNWQTRRHCPGGRRQQPRDGPGPQEVRQRRGPSALRGRYGPGEAPRISDIH